MLRVQLQSWVIYKIADWVWVIITCWRFWYDHYYYAWLLFWIFCFALTEPKQCWVWLIVPNIRVLSPKNRKHDTCDNLPPGVVIIYKFFPLIIWIVVTLFKHALICVKRVSVIYERRGLFPVLPPGGSGSIQYVLRGCIIRVTVKESSQILYPNPTWFWNSASWATRTACVYIFFVTSLLRYYTLT